MLAPDLPYWLNVVLTITAMGVVGWGIGLLMHIRKVKPAKARRQRDRQNYSYTTAYRSRQ